MGGGEEGGALSTEGILPDGQLCNKYGGVCVVCRVSPAATHCCRLGGYLSARGGSGLDSTFSNFTLHLVLGDWQLSTVSAEIIHMEVSNLQKKKNHIKAFTINVTSDRTVRREGVIWLILFRQNTIRGVGKIS